MKYQRMEPRVVFRAYSVELPDGVDPQNYQLAPGERLIDETGHVVKEGATMDRTLQTAQDMLSDVQDLLQDAREIYSDE